MKNRRDFLKAAGSSLVLGSAIQTSAIAAVAALDGNDETSFTKWYDVDRSITNLENAYWNVMARPVSGEYFRKLAYVNRRNVPFVRGVIPDESLPVELEKVRASVAKLVNADIDEIALTRCGTEALQDLISGYNGLKPGDRIIFCDLDYDTMQDTMRFLKERRGVEVVTFVMPEPATTGNIFAAYDDVLKKTPNVKLMLVTHLCHRTGLVNPVKEIIALAREHGVTCILDTAQAVGQMQVDVKEIDADFAGFSLHKWVGAPLGTGAVYIRKSRLNNVEPCLGNSEDPADDVRSRIDSGTYNFAATLTIPAAIDFHNQLTVERKRARLQYLRNYWVLRVREIDGVEILTPDDPARYGATTSFRLKGMKSFEQAKRVQDLFLAKYNVLTVARTGITRGAAVRVTPALYNTHAELDRLVVAIKQEYRLLA
ncbi:MAG TPA: aminotransferase class V-fold PLP-dependent enzyme [Silvibacterium sp.]|nr:aminotransferase class V-fold PLP-dependent enzyme [Silvibacterium sp.]